MYAKQKQALLGIILKSRKSRKRESLKSRRSFQERKKLLAFLSLGFHRTMAEGGQRLRKSLWLTLWALVGRAAGGAVWGTQCVAPWPDKEGSCAAHALGAQMGC